ncbi:MAG: inositol monophosphatase family protein [Nitrospinae bacterium]|jgi:myo-inositol-1(or 4)-monophosphatase|nr:inositol monophosphatase family protein [Nitrospinota bacterium]MDA1108684.1 inositol monophosphatase family protein [Nitrospinota bacterium]
MKDALEVAVSAALAAGKIQRERSQNIGKISHKGKFDLVTEVDFLCEQEVIRIIKKRFPDHEFLAEESGASQGLSSSSKWIIDPLDGTINYAHGFPVYCVSIGLEHEGELILGVVYNPCMDELFVAEKGQGATMNGNPIAVSTIPELKDSLLVTGFTPEVVHSDDDNMGRFSDFMKASQAVRRPGSAAIDICYTAMGRFEGFWELKLHAWDVAAGIVIMREAGGTVTRLNGNPLSVYDRQILASNGLVHAEMVEILAR